ncbi:MAG: TatD family hydrolase [Actinomycetota bacterium]
MTATWIDSHCHLQERYLTDGELDVEGPLRRAAEHGISALICVGTDADTSRQAIALASDVAKGRFGSHVPAVRAVVGLHPHEALAGTAEIEELLSTGSEHIAGVGECGLDYFYEHSPRDDQRKAFAAQIGLAHTYALPLVIHARDAWDDLFAILDSEGVPPLTVLHCFTGGPSEAVRCLGAGMTVSFSGIVSFPKAPEVREAAAIVPLDRLLIETDSPFLAPVPHRGKQNEPSYVPFVGMAVAEAKGLSIEEVAAATTRNARNIFGC